MLNFVLEFFREVEITVQIDKSNMGKIRKVLWGNDVEIITNTCVMGSAEFCPRSFP